MEILLSPEDIALADAVAHKRQAAAEAKGRISGNGGATRGSVALRNHIFGARCELAGKKYLDPIKWNDFSEIVNNDLPDLGDFIDVKGITQRHHRLVVQKKDRNDWAYLLVSSQHHPWYLGFGWLWGHEAKDERFWDDPVGGRAAFFVNTKLKPLRPPSELLAIVRSKD